MNIESTAAVQAVRFESEHGSGVVLGDWSQTAEEMSAAAVALLTDPEYRSNLAEVETLLG